MPVSFNARAFAGVLTGSGVPHYTDADHARLFGAAGGLAVHAVIDQVTGSLPSFRCVLEHSCDGRTWLPKQTLVDAPVQPSSVNSLQGADRGDTLLLPFARLRSELYVSGGATSARAVILVCGRDRTSRLDPRTLAPAALYLPGGFSAASSPHTWVAMLGDAASAASDPARTATNGCPVFDYSAATGEVHLESPAALSTWGGAASSSRHLAARVDLRGITTSDPTNIWLNAAAISDSLAFTGLHFRASGGSTYAYYYDFDTAARRAEVDVTSLLASGFGPLTVQGRKTAGAKLEIKVGAGPWLSGDTIGATGNVGGALRIGYRADMMVRAVLTWPRALSDSEAESVASWGQSL